MKSFFISLVLFLALPFCISAQERRVDSLDRYKPLDELLDQFYSSLERVSVDEKNKEFDTLISSCHDSLTRQHVTMQIFDHYQHSRVMGEESVAMHIYDRWIASGEVKPRGEFEGLLIDQWVLFNRENLLGMQAVPVSLYTPCGGRRTYPVEGKVNVMFFYDINCSKCRLESAVLPSVLSEVDFPMEFVAVYVGDDKRGWRAFRRNFKVRNPKVKVRHLWDPEVDSGYQKAYAVLATPRMFVIWKDGEIIGRRLEVVNLKEIIHYISITDAEKEEKAQ